MSDWINVSDLTPRIAYTATASQTAFVVPFVFFADEDLLVYQNDVLLTLTTHYTVTGEEDEDGGTVTLLTGATVGDAIVIVRDVVIELTTHIPPSGPLDIAAINIQFSKLIAIDQRLSDRIDRSLHFPDSDGAGIIVELPAIADRALKFMAFDADGNPTAAEAVDSAAVSSVMLPVIGAATLALARTELYAGSALAAFGSASTVAAARAALFDPATAGVDESQTIKATGTGVITLSFGSTGHVWLGSGSFSADDSALLINRALTPASGLLNSHAVRDESTATQAVTGSGFSGYSSFDAAATISGSATTDMNHIRNFQARTIYNSSGHVNEVAGLWAGHTNGASAGTVDQSYGVHVINATILGGAISNQYAFYADTLSGATNNWFLFGGSNPSALGGKLFVGGALTSISAEVANVQFNGSTQQGLALIDTYASAATLTALNFVRNNSVVGSITETLSATAYNTSSDERLKNFTGEYSGAEAIAVIRADPVRTFTWKGSGEAAIGWGAQTSHSVSSDLASPGNDKQPGEEGFQPWGVDQGKRTPYLWAAVNYLLDQNDALKSRLDALEARLAAGL